MDNKITTPRIIPDMLEIFRCEIVSEILLFICLSKLKYQETITSIHKNKLITIIKKQEILWLNVIELSTSVTCPLRRQFLGSGFDWYDC